MLKKVSLGLFLFSLADGVFAQAGFIGPYDVEAIQVLESGTYFRKPAALSGFPNPFNCADNKWIAFENGTKLGDRALSAGLAAQASGRKVEYYITGCSSYLIKATIIQILP